ncbi:MAG: general secretion pathway protein GspK, partial [Candidatus Omnitrophica bacterium]|nr:general secretion pathway protein GspK [Candidatus Omnitrophota bacterium]
MLTTTNLKTTKRSKSPICLTVNARSNNPSAFALILTVGVLALIALIAFSFAVNTRLEQNTASIYTDSLKARCLAEGGINTAIAELKKDARNNFVYNGSISNYSDDTLYDNRGTYSVEVKDEQSKLNIHIDHITSSTVRILRYLGLSDQQIANLIDYQDIDNIQTTINVAVGVEDNTKTKDAPFDTLEEMMAVDGIGEATYETYKADLTIYSYEDPNTIDDTAADEARCPINVNTASKNLITAVLTGISDGTDTISSTEADNIADDIISQRPYVPPDGWSNFNACIDNCVLGYIIQAEADIIKNNANPNRTKPSVYTTDFCFFSGGKYTLTATGTVYATASQATVRAQKQVKAVIDIYGILNQTKKEQFQGSDTHTTPVAFKVTTYDSCPVESINSTNDWNSLGSEDYPASGNYKVVHNAIKNGFWDNFDDDVSSTDLFYVDGEWMQANESNRTGYLWTAVTNIIDIYDEDSDADGDYELVFVPPVLGYDNGTEYEPAGPIVLLGPDPSINTVPPELEWDDFAWRSTTSDGISVYQKKLDHPAIAYCEWHVKTRLH